MVGVYEPKITSCCVANLGNSLAITCDLRLALGDFEFNIRSPRINQRFLMLCTFELNPGINIADGERVSTHCLKHYVRFGVMIIEPVECGKRCE